tara:strand:- start:552 stop:785 length:234 start_codon:yes stop_codon:yes gene_type:complete
MLIEIVTPDRNVYSGDVSLATFPGSDGSFGIKENHAPMVATLKEGKIKVIEGGKEQFFDVKGGVVEVNHNKIIVLAE